MKSYNCLVVSAFIVILSLIKLMSSQNNSPISDGETRILLQEVTFNYKWIPILFVNLDTIKLRYNNSNSNQILKYAKLRRKTVDFEKHHINSKGRNEQQNKKSTERIIPEPNVSFDENDLNDDKNKCKCLCNCSCDGEIKAHHYYVVDDENEEDEVADMSDFEDDYTDVVKRPSNSCFYIYLKISII